MPFPDTDLRALIDADPAQARPLHAVKAEELEPFLAGLPAAQAAWLRATGWKAASGDTRPIPAPDGAVIAAVVGLGSAQARARERFALAAAPAALQGGVWRLHGLDDPDDRAEAALAWLLSAYRFGGLRDRRGHLCPPAPRRRRWCGPRAWTPRASVPSPRPRG